MSQTQIPNEFLRFRSLSSSDIRLSKELLEKCWNEYEKIDFQKAVESISMNKDEILDFVEEMCGLRFKKLEIKLFAHSNKHRMEKIRIVTSDTSTPLGFMENYLERVDYKFYSDGAGSTKWNPTTNEFQIYFNASINYQSKDMGGNGMNDWNAIMNYNLTTGKLTLEKRLLK